MALFQDGWVWQLCVPTVETEDLSIINAEKEIKWRHSDSTEILQGRWKTGFHCLHKSYCQRLWHANMKYLFLILFPTVWTYRNKLYLQLWPAGGLPRLRVVSAEDWTLYNMNSFSCPYTLSALHDSKNSQQFFTARTQEARTQPLQRLIGAICLTNCSHLSWPS